MDALSNLIQKKYTKKSAVSKQMQSSLIIDKANTFIKEKWGKAFAAKAVSFRSKTLKINCDNPVISQEIKFNLNTIKESLNSKLGQGTIRKVMIVQEAIEKRDSR